MPPALRPFSSLSSEQLLDAAKSARELNDLSKLKAIFREFDKNRSTRVARAYKSIVHSMIDELAPPLKTTLSELGTEPRVSLETPKTPPARRSRKTIRKSDITPTEEQEEALKAFHTGNSLKINAFAGTGKTSTLQLIAHSTNRTGLYLAFNKSIVRDSAGKFPDHVKCSTIHGMAFRALMPRYGRVSKLTEKINAKKIVELFKLEDWNVLEHYVVSADTLGYLILETVRRFSQSSDQKISREHVATPRDLYTAPKEVVRSVTDWVAKAAESFWEHMVAVDSPVPLGHAGYLKVWALSKPTISVDYILLDEAQDTSPVVLGILHEQRAQIVLVGDKHQQIYEWLGAINAMDKVHADATTDLTQSFRFGDVIAAVATKVLRFLKEPLALRGNPRVQSKVGKVENPQAVLARTNASTLVIIIDAIAKNRKPHLVGGTDDLKKLLRGVIKLKNNEPCDVPELFGFSNWQAVISYARSDEGTELQMFVNLVEAQGEKKLLWALNRCVEEDQADLTISTAHKAKGRQWKSVRLYDDFMKSKPNQSGTEDSKKVAIQPQIDLAELRLLYVALTRAKEELEIPDTIIQLLEIKSHRSPDSGKRAKMAPRLKLA
jgi:AAA domain/UvrD-like helicase C-terminal domain